MNPRRRRVVWRSVLVADTDAATGRYLGRTLPAEGFDVKLAETGSAILDLVAADRPDAIVLGADLPDMAAFDIIERIQSTMGPPLLMLLNAPVSGDVARTLNAGADDCMPKPLLIRELAARLRRLVRRRLMGRGMLTRIRTEMLDSDVVRWRASIRGKDIQFSSNEQAVLQILVEDVRKIVSYGDLRARVWASATLPIANRIRPVIRSLRHKLELTFDGAVQLIAEPQLGYRLVVADSAAFPRRAIAP